MKKRKVILDLCGGTGSWSEPYRKAGYDVLLCTLPECDIRGTTYVGDLMQFRNADGVIYHQVKISEVYGILAAPPCTMFSRARTTAKTPRDFVEAMGVVQMCLQIIWACRAKGSLKFWALENPVGYLRQFIGTPAYSFQPWWFGDQNWKFTDLWGYFNKPKNKRGAKKPKPFDRVRWASPKKPAKYAHLKLDRAGIRSITSPYFAQAFFKANR